MNILVNLLILIDSWLGTHLSRPTRNFRRREYFKSMMYNKEYIQRLNQHLLFHHFLYRLDPDDTRARYEHDVCATNILNGHALALAAWYNEKVFDYVDAMVTDEEPTSLPFYSEAGYFNYPLYQITTTDNLVGFLKESRFTDMCVDNNISIRRALLRDNEQWALSSELMYKNSATTTNYELDTLDSLLANTLLNRLVLSLSDKSISNNTIPQTTLKAVKNIQLILEAICFMSGVTITQATKAALVGKLKTCDLHSVGEVPNKDNPTKRCLEMLTGPQSTRGITLVTYLVRDKSSYETGGVLSGLLSEGTYVYNVFNPTALLGTAQYVLPIGERYQWFQFFEFKRGESRQYAPLKDSGIIYRDEITNFSELLLKPSDTVVTKAPTKQKMSKAS